MIIPASQADPGESNPHGLTETRRALAGMPARLESCLEHLDENSLEDLRPRLAEIMHDLLNAMRSIAVAAGSLPGEVSSEIEEAQRVLSQRLLEFRHAIGTGSTDTIRQSLRGDLMDSITAWSRLLEYVVDRIQSTPEDT